MFLPIWSILVSSLIKSSNWEIILVSSPGSFSAASPDSFGQDKDMETEELELDTSLNVKNLKRKSKSARKKVAKIRILDSDSEMELN